MACPECGGEGVTCSRHGLLSNCSCHCYCCGTELVDCETCATRTVLDEIVDALNAHQ